MPTDHSLSPQATASANRASASDEPTPTAGSPRQVRSCRTASPIPSDAVRPPRSPLQPTHVLARDAEDRRGSTLITCSELDPLPTKRRPRAATHVGRCGTSRMLPRHGTGSIPCCRTGDRRGSRTSGHGAAAGPTRVHSEPTRRTRSTRFGGFDGHDLTYGELRGQFPRDGQCGAFPLRAVLGILYKSEQKCHGGMWTSHG